MHAIHLHEDSGVLMIVVRIVPDGRAGREEGGRS